MTQTKLTRDSFHVFQANARNALKQSEQVPSVLICAGTGCIAGGAMKIYENIKAECESGGLPVYVGLKHDTDEEKSLHVKMSGCHGFCEMGPLVHIEPMGIMYIHVKPEDCREILERTVLGGEIIDRLVYHLDGVAYPRQAGYSLLQEAAPGGAGELRQQRRRGHRGVHRQGRLCRL